MTMIPSTLSFSLTTTKTVATASAFIGLLPLRRRFPRPRSLPSSSSSSLSSSSVDCVSEIRRGRAPSSSSLAAAEAGDFGTPFDFSSKRGWDDFYESRRLRHDRRKEDASNDDENDERWEGTSARLPPPPPPLEGIEWHPSIPHEHVISEIAPGSSCLVIGCGSSSLPRALYDAHNSVDDHGNGSEACATRVCCLDYSAVCVDEMRETYGEGRPGMAFVFADALNLDGGVFVELDDWFSGGDDGTKIDDGKDDNDDYKGIGGNKKHRPSERASFDAVVDKGLLDALMCGEGWDYDAARLLRGMSKLLCRDGGIYVLVSFKLSLSTKEFLAEEGERYGLEWDFDVEGKSNNKVSFSIGRRKI